MQITKMRHQKLLTAIESAQRDAYSWREEAARTTKRRVELETQVKTQESRANSLQYALSRSQEREAHFLERLRTREETIVQLGIRLADYGDPGQTLPGGTPPVLTVPLAS
jgi:chromosome segregation ATPase